MKTTLYHMGHCPYCKTVKKVIKELKIKMDFKDLDVHEKLRKELINGGGKQQVPCLKISEKGKSDVWLYESQEIIAFLRKHF